MSELRPPLEQGRFRGGYIHRSWNRVSLYGTATSSPMSQPQLIADCATVARRADGADYDEYDFVVVGGGTVYASHSLAWLS